MREDMDKVIVEKPRWGSRWIGSGAGRRYRLSEDVPVKQGMRQGYAMRKYPNENLNPLRRYLESQVNRPWDKIYSELCANIDRRNTVQEHIFTHIDNFVARNAMLIGGEVHVMRRNWGREPTPLRDADVELYVHPRTGILLRNRHYKSWSAKRREKHAGEREAIQARRRVLSDREQLLLLDGVWYRVELAALPAGVQREVVSKGKPKTITEFEQRWDMVRKRKVSAADGPGTEINTAGYLYGRCGVYAVSKRQLSERELRQYGLQQKGRETSRPFRFLAARRLHAGGVENVVGLVLHDLLLAHIAAGARHRRSNAALGGDALDVGHAVHRAAAHRRVGLDQLVGDAAGHRRCHRYLHAGDLRAVHAFPGGGRAEILADLAAATVVQLGIGADKHPFELAGGICLGAAFVGDAADADGFHSYLVAGGHLDRVGQAGLVIGHHAATGTGGEQGRGAGGESETFHEDILL